MGEPGIVIQIDESKFHFNVKSHRRRGPETPTWVFGLVDTSISPAVGHMEVVPNRNRETLTRIIRNQIRQGSTIHSDEWRTDSNIAESGYQHETVFHRYNFIAPETQVHTQHVESYWSKQKLRLKKSKGAKKTALPEI